MDEKRREPMEQDWFDDTETYVIQVNRYDTDDLLAAMQYFLLVRDTSSEGRYVVTSTATPQPPADQKT